MNSILKNFRFLALFLSVALFIQGCTEDDNADGDGLMPVVAGFTHNIVQDTGVVTFINTSEHADTYHWNFGDGTSSTEINPTHVFETGTYTVVLTATNAAGSSSTYEDVITINIPIPISVPFNFDTANVIYDISAAFNGASFAVVPNPAPGGSNDVASNVGAITNSGANWEGVFYDLASPINLANDMTIQMDVWSDQAVPVLLKLEQGTGPDAEVIVNHGGTGWENLIFTFNSTSAYSRFTLFIDGPGTTAGTFYIDNVRQTATVDTTPPVITLLGDNPLMLTVGDTYMEPGATAEDDTDGDISSSIVIDASGVDTTMPGTYTVTYNVMDAAGNAATQVTRTVEVAPCSETNNLELIIDFDCSTIDYAAKIVGNVNFAVVANPDQSGVNAMETMVGQINNAGANWENAFFNLDTPVDFATDKGIKMKFWSNQALPIKLKFEDGTEGPVEMDANHGGTGWEELSFTFTATGSYNDMVIFVDGPGTAAGTFYVDHIEQFAGDTAPANAPSSAAPAPTQDAANVGSVYGDTYTNIPIANYDPNWGQAGHTLVNPAYDTGDGTVLAYPNFNYQGTDFDGAQNFSAMEYLHIDIWVPEGTDRQVKVSPIDNSGNGAGEVLVVVPLTPGSWNSVDLPKSAFADQSWDSVVQMKFDGQFNGDGSANSTPFDIYLDNIYFWKEAGNEPFDDGLLNNGDFEMGADSWTNGSIANDGTNSYFSINVENAGNPWDVNLSQVLEMVEGNTYKLQFKAWSDAPRTLIAGIGLNEDPWTNVTETANLTTEMQDFEYTFVANFGSANSRVIFDMGHETGMVNIDNVALFLVAEGGGGGGGTGTNGCNGDLVDATAFPVTFEECESFLSTFGTIAVDIDENPDMSGINTSDFALKVEKNAGAEFWAGFQNNFPNTFPDMTTHSVKMKIYSSKANTKFRIELAQDDPNVGNPPGSFVTITDANTWTEVVVPFTAVPAPEAYFRIAIKPDNDENDSPITENGTYYFDDIEIVAN